VGREGLRALTTPNDAYLEWDKWKRTYIVARSMFMPRTEDRTRRFERWRNRALRLRGTNLGSFRLAKQVLQSGMRKLFLLSLLPACLVTMQPIDLVPRGSYCQPAHPDVYVCREDHGTRWKCINRYGRWSCWKE
jgi:hypothetical protein